MNFFVKKTRLIPVILVLIGTVYAPVYSPGVAERIIKNALVEVKKTGTIKDVAQFKQAYQDLPRMTKENYQEDYDSALKAVKNQEQERNKQKDYGLRQLIDKEEVKAEKRKDKIKFLIQNNKNNNNKIIGFLCYADKEGNITNQTNISDFPYKKLDDDYTTITLGPDTESAKDTYIVFSKLDEKKKNVRDHINRDNKPLAFNLTQLSKKNIETGSLIAFKTYYVNDVKKIEISFDSGNTWKIIDDIK